MPAHQLECSRRSPAVVKHAEISAHLYDDDDASMTTIDTQQQTTGLLCALWFRFDSPKVQ